MNTTAPTRRRLTAPLEDGNATITVYLQRDWKQRVKVHCAEQGVTISDYALALIAEDLKLT